MAAKRRSHGRTITEKEKGLSNPGRRSCRNHYNLIYNKAMLGIKMSVVSKTYKLKFLKWVY